MVTGACVMTNAAPKIKNANPATTNPAKTPLAPPPQAKDTANPKSAMAGAITANPTRLRTS